MKKILILLLVIVPFICTSSANNLEFIETKNINIIINSKKSSLECPIVLANSNILFPVKELCEKMSIPNTYLVWDSVGQAVTIFYNNKSLRLNINSNIAKLNDTEVLLPSSPILYNDRSYVPIRTVCEFLDCFVVWDKGSKTVFIKNSNDYFETKAFFDNLNSTTPKTSNVKIDIINEINNSSFANSIYIDAKKNTVYEKNIMNNDWHESKIKLSSNNTLEDFAYIPFLAGGMSKNSKQSSENYYVYEGFFPTKTKKLSYGKLFINSSNLHLEKMISETVTDFGKLQQNVIFTYQNLQV